KPFQTVAMDFITKLLESRGYDMVLTITNQGCSKATLFLPCHKSVDVEKVAALYTKEVFPHYGIPQKIIMDRVPRFTVKFTKELCSILGIWQIISTAYHPQTDGQLEWTNQWLE